MPIIAFCNLLFLNLSIASGHAQQLTIHQDKAEGTITVFRNGSEAILTHHARTGFRPYIHPIVAPDGKGVLTEYRPDHHKHQTGLYWGFTVMNSLAELMSNGCSNMPMWFWLVAWLLSATWSTDLRIFPASSTHFASCTDWREGRARVCTCTSLCESPSDVAVILYSSLGHKGIGG